MGLIGVVAGLLVRFFVVILMLSLGLLMSAAGCFWQDIPFSAWAFAASLSLVCVETGYVVGLIVRGAAKRRSAGTSLHDGASQASRKRDA